MPLKFVAWFMRIYIAGLQLVVKSSRLPMGSTIKETKERPEWMFDEHAWYGEPGLSRRWIRRT